MLGSWEINVSVGSMPEKVATAFGKLQEQLIGAEYTPIAYLGSQIVNGTNHAVLAEQTVLAGKDTKNVVVVIFNEKPGAMDLTLVNIERVVEQGGPEGGINVDVKVDLPAEAKADFDKAFEGFVGSKVTPFAYLGSQVVNGVNHLFACEVVGVTVEPSPASVAVVTVNSNTSIVKFDDLIAGSTSAKTLGYAFTWLKNKMNDTDAVKNGAAGKWNVNVDTSAAPQKVATAIGKLSELIGVKYTPIAYLGSQLVNGINHAVLAEQELVLAKPQKNIVLIIFNEVPGTGIEDLKVVSIKTLVEGGDGFGGTNINVEIGDKINKTAQELFDQKFGGFCGSVVNDFALLGTQVVHGTNFIFACEASPVLADNDGNNKKAVLVIVNDLTDNVQFIDILQPEINRSLGAPLGEWP